MRFFGSKQKDSTQRKRDGLNGHDTPRISETRSVLKNSKKDNVNVKDSGLRDAYITAEAPSLLDQQMTSFNSKKSGVVPAKRSPPPPTKTASQERDRVIAVPMRRSGSSPGPPHTIAAETDRSRSQSANPEKIGAVQKNAGASNQNSGVVAIDKKTPQSILHKNKHFAANDHSPMKTPVSASPVSDESTLTSSPFQPNNRVRFMSSSSSAVSETSEVHLMAGASVASSSAMSSSHGGENVFDKVLNMVMAEETERLNAMGMSRVASGNIPGRYGIYPAGSSEDDVSLGLISPNNLTPIDVDTGLEIGADHTAPIDIDTGLEIDFEYHDINDDEIDTVTWNMLNETANASKAGAVGFGENCRASDGNRVKEFDVDSRRCRSYESSHQQTLNDSSSQFRRVMSQGSEPNRRLQGAVRARHDMGKLGDADVTVPSAVKALAIPQHHHQTPSMRMPEPPKPPNAPSSTAHWGKECTTSMKSPTPTKAVPLPKDAKGHGIGMKSSGVSRTHPHGGPRAPTDKLDSVEWVAFDSHGTRTDYNSLSTF